MEKIEVEIEGKIRIDKYLSEKLDESRSRIEHMLQNGAIRCNGVLAKPSTKVKDKDQIEIDKWIDETDIIPENIPLEIVYESESIIIVNKPSGMVVHPGNGNKSGTLVNALLYYTNHLSDCNGEERPGIVHRIDKDTSGLLVVAKNNKAHNILAEEFQSHKIERTYIALVKGILKQNHITIDAPIGRDEKDRKKMAVTAKNSKNAITHIEVIKRFKNYTLIKCKLETGRTHQIRVHMAYIGYPLWNDPVYGKEVIPHFGQFLHSSEIRLQEPITKENLTFQVPLPKAFEDFLKTLEEEEQKK